MQFNIFLILKFTKRQVVKIYIKKFKCINEDDYQYMSGQEYKFNFDSR